MISTKYHGPSHARGARITARGFGTSATLGYKHSLRPQEVHALAAWKLVKKAGLDIETLCCIDDGKSGYVFAAPGQIHTFGRPSE